MARPKVEWSLLAVDRCFPQFLSADDHVSVDFRWQFNPENLLSLVSICLNQQAVKYLPHRLFPFIYFLVFPDVISKRLIHFGAKSNLLFLEQAVTVVFLD